ncbi:MAG: hypothetical protein ACOYYJ_20700 [Chloroflexota bacterium]
MDIGGLVHAFFDNAGPGGVVVLLVIGAACTIYYFLTRWIVAGDKAHAPAVEPVLPDEQPVSMEA